jgi:hypothetical protein
MYGAATAAPGVSVFAVKALWPLVDPMVEMVAKVAISGL